MKYDEFISVIYDDIAKTLAENSENILRNLIDGLPEYPCITEEQLKLCHNAVKTSVHLSIQIMFSYLQSIGMLKVENLSEHFERPDLNVIQGGLSEPKD